MEGVFMVILPLLVLGTLALGTSRCEKREEFENGFLTRDSDRFLRESGGLLSRKFLRLLPNALQKENGWGGIRTPGALRHTRFPGVHNQPLCHPSSLTLARARDRNRP